MRNGRPAAGPTDEQIAAEKAKYQKLDDEKRDALRKGRAAWRNACEMLLTQVRLVKSGDLDFAKMAVNAELIVHEAKRLDKKK